MTEPWVLAEQEAQRAEQERKPVCADCGRRIAQGWTLALDEGEYLCEKCARLRVVEI